MIRAVRADRETFKPAVFQDGLNVVLAKRTIEAAKRDSASGLGKSALLEIINFCLGGRKGATLSKGHVDGWRFTVELELGGMQCSATRSTRSQGRVEIEAEGDTGGWPVEPKGGIDGRRYLSVEDWKCPGAPRIRPRA